MTTRLHHIEVFPGRTWFRKKWRWRRVGGNGEITCTSQAFSSRTAAWDAAEVEATPHDRRLRVDLVNK